MKLTKTKQKIRLFFLPYLIVNTVFLLIYTFIIWYLYIRNGTIHSIDNSKIFYFIPGICSLVLFAVFVTPRLRFAIFNGSNGAGMFAYTLLPAIITMFTTAAINTYLRDISTPIVHLKNLDEFDKQQRSGFYTVENMTLDPRKSILDWGVRGKKDNELYVTFMGACTDTVNRKYNFWILEERDSFLGASVLAENAYDQVQSELKYYLDTINYAKVAYLERSVATENHQRVVRLINRVNNNAKEYIVFEPKFKPMAKRLSKEKYLALLAYFGGNLFCLLLFISIRLSTLKLYDHEKKKQLRH